MATKELPYKKRVDLALMQHDMDRVSLAYELEITYNMLCQYLGGFIPIPDKVIDQIEEILHISQL